jgi:hypothetical protein
MHYAPRSKEVRAPGRADRLFVKEGLVSKVVHEGTLALSHLDNKKEKG